MLWCFCRNAARDLLPHPQCFRLLAKDTHACYPSPASLSHKTKLPILATYLDAREMNDGLLFGLQPQYPRVCGEGLLLDDASPPHILSSASIGTSLKSEETFRFHSERPQPNQPHSAPQQRLSPKTSPHTSLGSLRGHTVRRENYGGS